MRILPPPYSEVIVSSRAYYKAYEQSEAGKARRRKYRATMYAKMTPQQKERLRERNAAYRERKRATPELIAIAKEKSKAADKRYMEKKAQSLGITVEEYKKQTNRYYAQKKKEQQQELLKVVVEANRVLSIHNKLRSLSNVNANAERNTEAIQHPDNQAGVDSGGITQASLDGTLRRHSGTHSGQPETCGREDTGSEMTKGDITVANKTEQLLQYLIDNWSKSFTLYELASVMDLTPSGVKYHMQKVVRRGLVDVLDAPKGTPFQFKYHKNTSRGKSETIYINEKGHQMPSPIPVFYDSAPPIEEPAEVTSLSELLLRVISLEKRIEELQYPQEVSSKPRITISPDGTVHIS
jgi:hypothetical protein